MAKYLVWLGIGTVTFVGAIIGIVAILLLSLPDVTRLKGCLTTEMYKVHLCPGGSNYAPLSEISPYMISSVIISEDASFYQHHGFDLDEIKESVDRNLAQGKFSRGGSTISQQLVKNVFLSPEKSLLRKGKEAFLTYELEKTFRKNEILERYLNVVEFGSNLYGIKPAAQFYFGKNPAQLNVLESAFLTSLLPNPKKYSVSFKQKKLTPFMRGRILTIAGKLVATHRISDAEHQLARANVDAFPWTGLAGASGTSEEMLNKIQNTDFSGGQFLEPVREEEAPSIAPSSPETDPGSEELKAQPE